MYSGNPYEGRHMYKWFRIKLKQASSGISKNNLSWGMYLVLNGRIDLILQAYLKKIFDWKLIDKSTVNDLNMVRTPGWEGCLFDEMDSLRVRTQVNFIASIIKKSNAKRALETGTHKAMFCYLLYLCDNAMSVDTFGNLAQSQIAVDILNKKFGQFIKYHLGDSRQTLGEFDPQYRIDFAWVDGGHNYDVCLSDLNNCARLKIPHLAVDDYKWNADVKKAVGEFVNSCGYELVDISNPADYRGIVYLRKEG